MEKLRKIDKRLVVGVCLLIVFLVLWFLTFPRVDIYRPATQQENDAASLQAYRAYAQDVDNFNKAILLDTKEFCDAIKNSSMKSDCVKLAPNYNKVNEGTPSEYSSSDVDNFNLMLLTKDQSYCSKIVDSGLMQECRNR